MPVTAQKQGSSRNSRLNVKLRPSTEAVTSAPSPTYWAFGKYMRIWPRSARIGSSCRMDPRRLAA
jgi:hypothetical protein